jgi:peptidoglycan/xylan/chitin deacetylase (PgdA/CDA1 family)
LDFGQRAALLPHLEEFCMKVIALRERRRSRRAVCNWSELQKLAFSGVYIGAHSISHAPISQMSAVRRNFEINESKRYIEAKFGSCAAFAYPFGSRGTYNSSTLAEVKDAGFQAAFLSHSDVITATSPIFELPRITLPDSPMPLLEFKARVRGGGIPLRKLREFANPR